MDAFISVPLVAVDQSVDTSTPSINASLIQAIRALSTAEAANPTYSGGNAIVELRSEKTFSLSEAVKRLVSSSSVSALTSAANSAIAGQVTNGQVTLVAGVAAITVPGVTTSNKGFTSLAAQGGTSTAVYEYRIACTANTVTITAVTVAGAAVTTDTSVINYFVL